MAIKFQEKGEARGTERPLAKPKATPGPDAPAVTEADETTLPFAKPVRADKKARKPKR